MDTYNSFTDLQRDNVEYIDYKITAFARNPNIIIRAPRGGWIECCTADIAEEIAGEWFSLYCFESLSKYKNLHIKSTNFDEPTALTMIKKHNLSVLIHACDSMKECVYVGGRNQYLKDKILEAFVDSSSIEALENTMLSGINKNNICRSGKGLQLEITLGLAHKMIRKPKQISKYQRKTPLYVEFTNIVKKFLLSISSVISQ